MNIVKRAIIMAAGIGKRMQPVTLEVPKPLVKVNGVRMIDTVIRGLRNNGITEIYIVVAPKTKLTVSIRGEARLNNGVCRYHILGIGFNKGEWEYIDVVNEYYDYYEETVY